MTIRLGNSASVAAFFDLDGTLFAKPSLERRFWRVLQYRRQIPLRNYAAWIWQAIRTLPLGLTHVVQANKQYLRGVTHREDSLERVRLVPEFFPDAIECVLGHARRGEKIVVVSGTLEPLAVRAAMTLRLALKRRGCEAAVHVCATHLEETRGKWSGRILGEPMFGEAKAHAVWRLSREWKLNLSLCSAYGDSEQDRWLLASVGHAFAVNPTRGLRRVARLRGWPVLRWGAAAADAEQQHNFSPSRARGANQASSGELA